MYRISDFSIISLPFRVAELELNFVKGNFDFKTNSAIEYRWKERAAEFDLREIYLVWYPSWGEVKIGKQIHAWGAMDGNNPTDNLNAYDYYYLFLPGVDRKIGTLSGSIKYYWNDWQFEAVVIPEHKPNRYPFGEKDFPIAMNDPSDFLKDAKNGYEYGFRLQTIVGNSDLGFSFFDGRDRGFTLGGYENTVNPMSNLPSVKPGFSYRKTTAAGMDFVTFIGDFTLRGESSYFKTINDYSFDMRNDLEASYLQYAFQLEYLTTNDYIFAAQLIGNEILSLKGIIYEQDFEMFLARDVTKDDFQPGMGTPFATFTDRGMFLSVTTNFLDNALEVRLNTFLDLEDSQTMLGGGVSYSPLENWEIDYSLTKLIGEERTIFKEIEDFSNLQLMLTYSF